MRVKEKIRDDSGKEANARKVKGIKKVFMNSGKSQGHKSK